MKENSGYLSRNDKATSDKHPSHKGRINVAGTEYWLAAWVKENERGKYFSLAIKPVEDEAKPAAPAAPKAGGVNEMLDDVPF